MKKGTKKVAIIVASTIAILIGMSVLGNSMPDEDVANESGTSNSSGKSELIMKEPGNLSGIFFEDGTYYAFKTPDDYRTFDNSPTTPYVVRYSFHKQGKCFLFSGYDLNFVKGPMFEVEPGMVVYHNSEYCTPTLYREHSMEGIPIIDEYTLSDAIKVITTNNKTTIFNLTETVSKIAKIPVEGAIIEIKRGDEFKSINDSFNKPIPLKVTVPYSIFWEDSLVVKWSVTAPRTVTETDRITMTEKQIAALLQTPPTN